MINGLDIYYSKNIGEGLKPVGNNKQQTILKANGLKPVSNKGGSYKKFGQGLKNTAMNLIFVNNI